MDNCLYFSVRLYSVDITLQIEPTTARFYLFYIDIYIYMKEGYGLVTQCTNNTLFARPSYRRNKSQIHKLIW